MTFRKRCAILCSAVYFATTPVFAADLMISEYIEGSSNNKAVELFNAGINPVDLSAYQLKFFFNGNTIAGTTIALAGQLEAGQTHVVMHAQASSDWLPRAHQTNSSSWFNGDDALVLMRDNEIIDSLGQIGVDPGSAWQENNVSTQDATLRKNQINVDTNPYDAFSPAQSWQGFAINSIEDLGHFGTENPETQVLGNCHDTHLVPHDIQGDQAQSPRIGELVVVEAIISADFRGEDQLRGVYVQSPTEEYDANPLTSEAVFVYDPSRVITATIGERIRVLASVAEYSGQTQLTQIQGALQCGAAANVNSTPLLLPLADGLTLEAFEGVLVRSQESITVSDSYNLARYGELTLSFGGPLQQPTNVALPGANAQALQQANNARRILLDDASTRQNPSVIPYPMPQLRYDHTVRVGDMVHPFNAVLSEAFNAYRLQPTETPAFENVNLRGDAPSRHPDTTVRVASFNVLNYFNGDGLGAGYPTPRGANTAEEFARQRIKIAQAITELNADIVGLMEMENDGDDAQSAMADLIRVLNSQTTHGGQWMNVGTSLLGSDQIRVALIYRADKVIPFGSPERLETGAFATANRVPLLQRFADKNSAQVVSVVVNHFKSKGSCPSDANDVNADRNDGQSCWNALRTHAAIELSDWLASINEHERIVLMGDFNAYRMEDPIRALQDRDYQLLGNDGDYSYVFNGQRGSLDHSFANSRLSPEIVQTKHWAINADEPRALDYNMEFKTVAQQLDLYGEGPFRSSDHDPVIVDIGARQFRLAQKKSLWLGLVGKREWHIPLRFAQTLAVNAAAIKVDLLHFNPSVLQWSLRAPNGEETAVAFNTSQGLIQKLNTAIRFNDLNAEGEWQLVVRSDQPSFGWIFNAELRLD